MMRQYQLVEKVMGYDPNADMAALNKAYVYAMKMHGAQRRASGDPYFSHPIEVAGILTEYKLDSATIITALLHDVVEDTDATVEDIENMFGREIARLVDGVTKLAKIELSSEGSKQAENFRKLLMAMSDDIRVLLVKLADRLHNMQTLHFIQKPEKRKRIATETLEIYAPLAERIGMQEIKINLQELSFSELHPDARSSITQRMKYLSEQESGLVDSIAQALEKVVLKGGVKGIVSGRQKSPYSIWRKMHNKNVTFEELTDIYAFRIIVPSLEDCYKALGLVHAEYRMIPERFKDYISTPKPNGYRSIHTSVFWPGSHRIEVQIRTQEMHEIAEMGVAAHWRYKQGDVNTEGRQFKWIRQMLDILEHAQSPDEFLKYTKLEMFQDQVFCFTPKGDVMALPKGATPIDFAYMIHTEVGDHCTGAKVNGAIVPLQYQLRNGDQVDVTTSRTQTPHPEWERIVVTGKARARIRRYVRSKHTEEYQGLGRSILQKKFQSVGKSAKDKVLEKALSVSKFNMLDDLYYAIGIGDVTATEVLWSVYPETKPADTEVKHSPAYSPKATETRTSSQVPIRGLIPGLAVHFAGCCHPLPGDRIVGIVMSGKGVTIHTIDCEQLAVFQDQPERWLDIAWDQSEEHEKQVGRIALVVLNEPGSLGNISMTIAKNKGNISNLKITSRTADFFELYIDVEVQDVRHLLTIMAALRTEQQVNSVERVRH
jgi:GTP pyrophosphokinase